MAKLQIQGDSCEGEVVCARGAGPCFASNYPFLVQLQYSPTTTRELHCTGRRTGCEAAAGSVIVTYQPKHPLLDLGSGSES